jgi:hypothetical protein
MQKDKDLKKFENYFYEGTESKLDTRLQRKRVEHGFTTRADVESMLKSLPAETEYDFTSAEALDAEGQD